MGADKSYGGAVSAQRRTWRCAVLSVALITVCGSGYAIADPDTLWHIVHDQCVIDAQQHGDPAPCARLDTSMGDDRGYAVLKDARGARQYLLIPTGRISGIESPVLLEPDATNYFAAAWTARSFVEQRAGGPVPRDWMSLTVNDRLSRSQEQLHIHIDCLRADVHEALRLHGAEIGRTWSLFPWPLAGSYYRAIALKGETLGATNPFALAAEGLEGAGDDMGLLTLAVVGSLDDEGIPGFILLAGEASSDKHVASEKLQDHDSCTPSATTIGK